MRLLAAMICALGLAACATAPAASGEREDPFVMMIDAGRIQIFADRIGMAGELLESGPPAAETDLIKASRNLREGVLAFLLAKERACAEGKFVAQSCARLAPPAWLAEPSTQAVSPGELRRRIAQVQTIMTPLVDAACEAGKAKSGDDLFCSVE